MKVAIWGLGFIFRKYESYFKLLNVEFFIDKNVNLQVNKMWGKDIKSPQMVDFNQIDYVVIATDLYDEIKKELQEYGVEINKIKSYKEIGDLWEKINVITSNGNMELTQWCSEHENKILLNSHELTYTGTPILLLNLACVLRDLGYSVLFTSVRAGNFEEELKKQDIDYIPDISPLIKSKKFIKNISGFERIISVNISIQDYVREFAKVGVPVIWWIHESLDECYQNPIEKLPANISLYAGGNRVIKQFEKYYPHLNIEQWLYNIPDEKSREDRMKGSNKIVFAIIGSICKRKAQNVLLDALDLLERKDKTNIEVWIVGGCPSYDKEYSDEVFERIKHMQEVVYKGELSQADMKGIYGLIDVLVCPSLDDPMPLVVTEAMINEKLTIISKEVGQIEFVEDKQNALVASSACELASSIKFVIDNTEEVKKVAKNGRKIYEKYFTTEIMMRQLKNILEN